MFFVAHSYVSMTLTSTVDEESGTSSVGGGFGATRYVLLILNSFDVKLSCPLSQEFRPNVPMLDPLYINCHV